MIETKEQISNVRRSLHGRTLDAGEARVITLSQVYDTDLDDMWDVVTSADRIRRWFLPVSGDLREGGTYQLTGNAGGTITRCDKPNSFAATWEFGDQVSWIEVRLTAAGPDRTRFELEHVAPIDEKWAEYGPGAVGIGWDMGLLGLANHLADPAAEPDHAAMMAWAGSAEGAEFMRLSNDAWTEADIADGTDPAVARTRAGATYAAYTGAS